MKKPQAQFIHAEWNKMPPAAETINGGNIRITRNVAAVERDGATLYVGEIAIMSEAAYAAYVGAMEAEAKREAEVIDDYTLSLIEEGVL